VRGRVPEQQFRGVGQQQQQRFFLRFGARDAHARAKGQQQQEAQAERLEAFETCCLQVAIGVAQPNNENTNQLHHRYMHQIIEKIRSDSAFTNLLRTIRQKCYTSSCHPLRRASQKARQLCLDISMYEAFFLHCRILVLHLSFFSSPLLLHIDGAISFFSVLQRSFSQLSPIMCTFTLLSCNQIQSSSLF